MDKIKEYRLKLLQDKLYRVNLDPIKYFEPLPMGKLYFEDESKDKNFFGGNRSSKSHHIAAYVIKKCLAKPRQYWWVVSETFQDSVNIMQKKFWQLMPKAKMYYCKYNEILGFTNRKIIFPNMSMASFKSYDQSREAFQGDAVHGIANDEEPPYDIYKEQRMRLIDFNGEMLLSMTSLKGMTDLMSEIYENADIIKSMPAPLLDGMMVPRIAEKDGIKLYFLWTTENPYINQERVMQEIKHLSRDEIKSRIYGIPVGISGRVYPMFNKDVHVIPFDQVPERQVTLYNVIDPHDRKPWAIQWWAVDKTNTAYCVWEYPFEKNFNEMDYDDKTIDEYCKVIKNTEKTLFELFGRKVTHRIIDPNYGNKTVKLAVRVAGQSRTTIKRELKERGLRYRDGIDEIRAGHIQVKDWLYWEEKGNEIIVRPKMYVVDHCENTSRHLSRYSHGDIETTAGDVRDNPKPKEKYKDYADTTRYFAMSDPKYVNPNKQDNYESEKMY